MRSATGLLLALLFVVPSLLAKPVATILCYHEVDDAPAHETIVRKGAGDNTKREQRRYTSTKADFAAQLDYLAANGYTVIPLTYLDEHLAGTRPTLPPKSVVITVDDGWLCAYTSFAPEMKKRGLPWTLYVYPKIVSRGDHAVTWDQLAELSRDGVDIGSHSFTHPFLTLRNNTQVTEADYPAFLQHEAAESRAIIEKLAGAKVRHFAYPYGDYDAAVIAAIQSAGYTSAVTVERGPVTAGSERYRLPRYLIHNDTTLETFKTYLPQIEEPVTVGF